MADPQRVAVGLADLAMKVKDKADQAETNQVTCKILAGHIAAVIPVIKDLKDKICEEDERLQDFVEDMGYLLVEIDKLIDKIRSRNTATKLLKASSDERELTAIKERLAQISQRATFQILTIVTEIKSMLSGEGATANKKKAFRPLELKLLSTQTVDLEYVPDWVLMRKTGQIVFASHENKEGGAFLYLYTVQEAGALDKNKIDAPCDRTHRLNMLSIQILWREYLAISCRECRDIKLVDLETKEITTAYKDGQPFGKMCKGWHKICVRVEYGYLKLDSSSTKFTKMRYTETGNDGFTSGYDLCYVPPPLNTNVTIGGGSIRATSLDEPNKNIQHLSCHLLLQTRCFICDGW